MIMNFKEDVEFYLKNNKGFNYYGFDIENGSIAEEDDDGEEGSSDSEASVKTKEKKTCSKCGKEPCECKDGDDEDCFKPLLSNTILL